MNNDPMELEGLHWLFDIIQNIDVGLLVLDKNYRIHTWNGFMENHSGQRVSAAKGRSIFEVFEDLPEQWLKSKIDSVFMLNNRAFVTWEQRPYLFKFTSNRPITGTAPHMFQNITFLPVTNTAGEVEHVSIIIYDVSDIAAGQHQLEKANRNLESLSRIDGLTQLYNRRFWEECIATEFSRYKRTKGHCSVVMFDIDHFKMVNDTYGHPAGDEVIRQVSAALRSCVRDTDISGRYGGEEFTVILIDTPADDAYKFAERLRECVAALKIEHAEDVITLTISLGIAEISQDMQTYSEWIEASDQGLYEAKESGRNRTCMKNTPKLTN